MTNFAFWVHLRLKNRKQLFRIIIRDRYPKNLTSPTRFCTRHNNIGSYKSYYNLNITSCNINFTFKLFYIFSSRCIVVGLKMEKYYNKIKIYIHVYLAYDAKKKSYVFLAHHAISSWSNIKQNWKKTHTKKLYLHVWCF